MTYTTGSPVLAADYNGFATVVGGMNEVFADLHAGATTLPDAGFGYGQTPPLTQVGIGTPIFASGWDALFTVMRRCETHQGSEVTPPVPPSGPLAGQPVAALNVPMTMQVAINQLRTNRFALATGQSTLIPNIGSVTQPGALIPWINSLTFNFRVDLSSWNNARYFFNSGGSILITGVYVPPGSPQSEDLLWQQLFSLISPMKFSYNNCTAADGATGSQNKGFYNLTTNFADSLVLKRALGGGGGGYYTGGGVEVRAKYSAAPGANGQIEFEVKMISVDTSPPSNPKAGVITYTVGSITSSGAIVYPGPAPTVVTVGGNAGFTRTPP
jgi:hypothetical protein